MERNCKECGSSDWSKIVEKDYPERKRERDRTIERVYVCSSCGAQGKHFEHQSGGADTVSGALR